ncbi:MULTISPECIES: hypothetical protein [unclassified Clostridium]|uniref:hypothetical protein n=1 Tax=unclassified Clostridium TaxID=2614128 RepID=UPI0013F10C6D|nr:MULTISPECIES: hypothetical protein [unclassified Clostridium]NFG62872.1 hypothetical protein [Clostridium botulinum]NFQ08744.1 hypothetical protein [Clostridium botulinum]
MNDTVDHIFKGVVKNVGTANGWHYIGVADNGITIEMYLYRNAEKCNISDIITAYPVHVDTLK